MTEITIETRVIDAITRAKVNLGKRIWLANMAAGLVVYHAVRPIPHEFVMTGPYYDALTVLNHLEEQMSLLHVTGVPDAHGVKQMEQKLTAALRKATVPEDAKVCWGLAVDSSFFCVTVIQYRAVPARFSPVEKRNAR